VGLRCIQRIVSFTFPSPGSRPISTSGAQATHSALHDGIYRRPYVVFGISLQNSHGTVDVARVEHEMENFMNSRAKESETIHVDIRTFLQGVNPLGRDSIVHKIESLIYFNTKHHF
jgi:hypothetical protein